MKPVARKAFLAIPTREIGQRKTLGRQLFVHQIKRPRLDAVARMSLGASACNCWQGILAVLCHVGSCGGA